MFPNDLNVFYLSLNTQYIQLHTGDYVFSIILLCACVWLVYACMYKNNRNYYTHTVAMSQGQVKTSPWIGILYSLVCYILLWAPGTGI